MSDTGSIKHQDDLEGSVVRWIRWEEAEVRPLKDSFQ